MEDTYTIAAYLKLEFDASLLPFNLDKLLPSLSRNIPATPVEIMRFRLGISVPKVKIAKPLDRKNPILEPMPVAEKKIRGKKKFRMKLRQKSK